MDFAQCNYGGLGPRDKLDQMNWNFFAHIIRDVFPAPIKPLIYGHDLECLDAFRSNAHSLGFLLLYDNEKLDTRPSFVHYWSIYEANMHFGRGYCDLFVNIGGPSDYPMGGRGSKIDHLDGLMEKGGFILLVDPGEWALGLRSVFREREDLANEMKCYSMLEDREVEVYEKV